MNGPRDNAPFFLCSPIPRDPTQLLFVDDGAPRQETTPTAKSDSFFDPQAEEMSGLRRTQAAPASPTDRRSTVVDAALHEGIPRAAKRPRVEEHSRKNDQHATEVASLRLQLESHRENHQVQLKERDLQVSQLRRQLQYALSEEEHARSELKTLTTAFATEKLTLQKKAVELESKLQFVETSFNEWRERADDTANELRGVVRESKLKIQLLADELEIAKSSPQKPASVEYSLLESKMKHLEVSLLDKERQVQHADDRVLNASVEIEASKDTRWMKQRIAELESQERRLKQELVALIESSRSSALYDEKMMQMRQKLQKSDERFDAAQKELIESHQRHEEEVARLKQEAKAMQNDVKKLAAQLEKTERECAVLEKRLGRGEYNPQKIKVVHMAVNPTSELLGAKQGTSELEELRREVEQLRSQLVSSSSEAAGAPPRTPMEMTTPANRLTTASKLTTTTSYETVEGQKLLNQRLKEVFQNQIQQYREAVYQLTGFKVDLKKSNGMELLRLRSMYADHDDDELLVRMEPSGALELLETDFCGQINKRVFAYLTTCRSFPAFLSTLTLHLFEKQTFQGN